MDILIAEFLAVALIATVGGIANNLQDRLDCTSKSKRKIKLAVDLLLSLLAGFGALFLCKDAAFNVWETLFCVLVSGLSGAEVLWAFRKKFNSMLGIEGKRQ